MRSQVVVVSMLALSATGWSVKPSASELGLARQFVKERQAKPCFSFVYDGRPSSSFLGNWTLETSKKKLDGKRTETTTVYSDPGTGLQVACRMVAYSDFPTVEWVLSLRNTGKKDTPILEKIRPLDVLVSRKSGDAEFVLHHNQGSMTSHDDFQPFESPLPAGSEKILQSEGGRPMSSTMPYMNLTWGNGGLIVAVSWVGDWTSSWVRDDGNGLRIAAGQQVHRFRLHPGEEVRTPMIVLQFWQGGDRVRSHNIWRRWMQAHSMPKPGGKPFPIMISSGIPDARGNLITFEKEELDGIEWQFKRKLPVDVWWRDAGWYPCGDGWWNVGTWEPDPVRFPNGLKPMADAAHKAGMKLTVWWEPERVVPGTKLYAEHPEWLLGPEGGQKLFDLGNKQAWTWLVNTIDAFIGEQGIDMYRQDFNMDPTPYWRWADAPDRVGITEIRQCEGLIALWDELKRRRPYMPFDNCAGGGRRNVVEMMRRGVPLSKTDDAGGTASSQCQLMGLAPWLPYFGAGIGSDNLYELRSNMAPWSAFAYDCQREDLDWDRIRLHMKRCRELAPLMLGDFYPLTSYSLAEDIWAAWQFDRPETGQGMVQAFRRTKSDVSDMVFKLRGLDPKASYAVQDIDTSVTVTRTGKDLMSSGLRVTIPAKPGAVIVTYKKEKKR